MACEKIREQIFNNEFIKSQFKRAFDVVGVAVENVLNKDEKPPTFFEMIKKTVMKNSK